jgi:O-antigen biosynthesis protein
MPVLAFSNSRMRSRRHVSEPPSPGFTPVRVDLVEIGSPLPPLPSEDPETGVSYSSSLCLVRLHGRPLGLIELDLPAGGIPAEQLAARIEGELSEQVGQHLSADGFPPSELTADGLAAPDQPRCIAAREQLLTRAPTVSVVIITRDRPARVRATVRSILAGRYPKDRYEVIVVDTPSESGTLSLSAEDEDLDGQVPIRVVEESRPGVSRGRNTGLDQAGGEFVVFADDDVDVDPNWLATSISAFGEGDHVGASSGMTLPGALATPSQRWFEGFGGLQRGFETRVYDIDEPPPDQPLFPFAVGELGSGRSMAFRRDLLKELGGFDLALGPDTPTLAGEDIEALWRVLLSGWEVVHEPAAIVWHEHPAHYEMLRRRMWGYGVGLTACLTKGVTQHPELLTNLVRKLPRGLAFALSPKSDKNRKRQRDYPPELIRLELLGLAYGPIAYSRSRWQRRSRNAGGDARRSH